MIKEEISPRHYKKRTPLGVKKKKKRILTRVEDLSLHQNLLMKVYNSFIHDCQNLEATKMVLVGERIKECGTSRKKNSIQC